MLRREEIRALSGSKLSLEAFAENKGRPEQEKKAIRRKNERNKQRGKIRKSAKSSRATRMKKEMTGSRKKKKKKIERKKKMDKQRSSKRVEGNEQSIAMLNQKRGRMNDAGGNVALPLLHRSEVLCRCCARRGAGRSEKRVFMLGSEQRGSMTKRAWFQCGP